MEHIGTTTSANSARVGLRMIIAVCITMTAALPAILIPEQIMGWYAGLTHPSFAPPDHVFGSVWIVLYWLMGIAAGLVWAQGARVPVKHALSLYGVQLLLNATWTFVFFGLHSPLLGLVVIVPLLGLIVPTMRSFFPINRSAGWMMLPYILWIAYTTLLNAAFVLLN